MLVKLLVGPLFLLTTAVAGAAPLQQAGPDPLATLTARFLRTSAMVTGATPGQDSIAPGSTLAMGNNLQSVATSALAPFDSTAGAQLSLGTGPSAPVRLAWSAGAVNAGLGATPFTPVYREGRVEMDVVLTLACELGRRWNIDAQAAMQATWGAGIGTAQVEIDLGDDGVIEATWGCLTPAHQLAVVATATDHSGLRIRIRATGEARSWTTSTPDHFAMHLTVDCTPASAGDHGVDDRKERGLFDLEGSVFRRSDAAGRVPRLASLRHRAEDDPGRTMSRGAR